MIGAFAVAGAHPDARVKAVDTRVARPACFFITC